MRSDYTTGTVSMHASSAFWIWQGNKKWKETSDLHGALKKHSLRQHSHSSDAFGEVIPRNPGKRDTSSFQFSRSVKRVGLFATPWTAARQASLSITKSSTQTHVHWVGDAIQPSHPLSSPCSPAFNLSQHQGLFQWVSSSHQVAKGLEFQFQHQSFQWIFRTDFL